MPEPSTEVENVLSAIRRLIEDGRPEGQGGSSALDRLMLTPALRVPEPLLLSDVAPPSAGRAEALDPRIAPTPVPLPPDPEEVELASDPGALEAASVAPDESADSLPEAAAPPAPWPDEAALRALVAEVLREELRGELGERLTRNLRKLVRREVMQALTLRDVG